MAPPSLHVPGAAPIPTAPVPTSLLPLPPDGWITDAQWRVLLAILDTIVPSVLDSISSQEYDALKTKLQHFGTDLSTLDAFLAETPSSIPLSGQLLKMALYRMPAHMTRPLLLVTSLLSTRPGTFVLTGHATPFDQLPEAARARIVNSWRHNSYVTLLRFLSKSLTVLAINIWIRTSPTFHAVTGFPPTPVGWRPVPNAHDFAFLQFSRNDDDDAAADDALPPVELETDAVIVGSGCGAAVCAANLAASGQRVLVVDKGYHFLNTAFPMTAAAAHAHMFEGGGLLTSDDGSIAIMAGSCWGGGGTVNWSASLQTQGFVRKEWAEERGLSFFQSLSFQHSLDRMCDRMGVANVAQHNHGNRVLAEGARKLGFHVKEVPQSGGCHHDDGTCTYGCWKGEKQGPANLWLPEAAKHGARFIEGFHVDKVLLDGRGKARKAVGVEGQWTSRPVDGNWDGPLSARTVRKLVIRAKRVIVSCGTLQSPLLLMRSGIKNNHLGKNLHLHPCLFVGGIFDEDVKPWEGSSISTVVTSFEDLDKKGHGCKLEALSMVPVFALCFPNWSSGVEFKKIALQYRHMNSFFTLVRERDTGYVYPDANTGKLRLAYTPSAFDLEAARVGLLALAKMLFLQGAKEIYVGVPGVSTFVRPPGQQADVETVGILDPDFQKWLAELQACDLRPPNPVCASAHQMGTCRMSCKETDGVVDPRGQVWGTQGLFVADASVFPSASGVNPMVTNMAISDHISRGLAADLAAEKVDARL